MSQRYLLWVSFDGMHFSGFAKSGSGRYGVLDLIKPLLNHVLIPRGFSNICCTTGSRTDAGVHVIRGPVFIHTGQYKYLIDETPEIKTEILGEVNDMLKKIQVDSLKLIDLHRVSNGFSPRKHISYRRYIYRLRVANTYEIYEKCLKEPSISCFAERNHSWTLPPNFDFHRANEICKKMEGTHNMGSFFKASKKIWNSLNPSPTYTYRTMNLVRVTPGSPICDFPDESFSYYNFEVVSRSFLREQIRRMVRVVVNHSLGILDKDALRILFDYPYPFTFPNLKLVSAPSRGLYLVDCVYDPKMFTDPVPYFSHGWDIENEDD